MKHGWILILLVLFLAACTRPLKNPEAVDLIFIDLKSQAEKLAKEIGEYDKEIATAKAAYERAPIRTGQRLDAQEEFFRLKKVRQKLTEKYRYTSLRLSSRLKEIRRAYRKAFAAGKQWPDEEEYLTYLTEKRLKTAPREWNPDQRIRARSLASQANNGSAAASSH
jgi:hypothetical protein